MKQLISSEIIFKNHSLKSFCNMVEMAGLAERMQKEFGVTFL